MELYVGGNPIINYMIISLDVKVQVQFNTSATKNHIEIPKNI